MPGLMIELLDQWIAEPLDVSEVQAPPPFLINSPAHVHLELESVPVHTAALVSIRSVRECVRPGECEGNEEILNGRPASILQNSCVKSIANP